jgi:hypothetical protein
MFSVAKFESITKNHLPIVHVDVDGQRYDFLIASGATISLIDSATCVKRKLDIEDNSQVEKIITLGGVFNKSEHVKLMNENFYVHDIHKLVEEVKDYTGVQVDGIIGYDILEHNKSTIDFQKEIISNLNKDNNAK